MGQLLTILTPTYNRANMLHLCYSSLQQQSCKEFEWIIIDDGSTDNTEQIVRTFQSGCNDFSIIYVKKENGGKHTVLNCAHDYINGELTIILDDDDKLTDDAVQTIFSFWKRHRDNHRIWCMSFSKSHDMITPLVTFEENGIISNAIDYRVNPRRNGDCAEVVRSDIFKKYSFPVFEGERFLGEDCMWITMSYEYDTVYYNNIIYICEYLDNGLTKSGRKMRLKNPKGGMYRNNIYLDNRFSLFIQIKSAILYDCYAISEGHIISNLLKAKKKILCLATLPLGLFFYLKWK